MDDDTDKIFEEIGNKNQREMEEALKKLPQPTQSATNKPKRS